MVSMMWCARTRTHAWKETPQPICACVVARRCSLCCCCGCRGFVVTLPMYTMSQNQVIMLCTNKQQKKEGTHTQQTSNSSVIHSQAKHQHKQQQQQQQWQQTPTMVNGNCIFVCYGGVYFVRVTRVAVTRQRSRIKFAGARKFMSYSVGPLNMHSATTYAHTQKQGAMGVDISAIWCMYI